MPGDAQPVPVPAPSRTAEVDGYTVTLDGDLTPGEDSDLTLTVARDGRPVTDLEPYLGAFGHLVALRDGGHADFEAAVQWEALAQPITLATEDLHEGIAASREKRPAQFRGR